MCDDWCDSFEPLEKQELKRLSHRELSRVGRLASLYSDNLTSNRVALQNFGRDISGRSKVVESLLDHLEEMEDEGTCLQEFLTDEFRTRSHMKEAVDAYKDWVACANTFRDVILLRVRGDVRSSNQKRCRHFQKRTAALWTEFERKLKLACNTACYEDIVVCLNSVEPLVKKYDAAAPPTLHHTTLVVL
jgi:hypothetical protein